MRGDQVEAGSTMEKDSKELMKDWPTIEHLLLLVDSIGEFALGQMIGYVDMHGIERAIWNNGCYVESFRYDPERVVVYDLVPARIDPMWIVDSISDIGKWQPDLMERYYQACERLDEMIKSSRESLFR